MFFFFSNRLGCIGSIAVTVTLSALLMLTMRSCAQLHLSNATQRLWVNGVHSSTSRRVRADKQH